MNKKSGEDMLISSQLTPGGQGSWDIRENNLYYIKEDESPKGKTLVRHNLETREELAVPMGFRMTSFSYPGYPYLMTRINCWVRPISIRTFRSRHLAINKKSDH